MSCCPADTLRERLCGNVVRYAVNRQVCADSLLLALASILQASRMTVSARPQPGTRPFHSVKIKLLSPASSKKLKSCTCARNINYTNRCTYACGFCAFSKGRIAEELRGAPYLLPYAEISRRTQEAWSRGASETCMQGGIHPEFTGAPPCRGSPCLAWCSHAAQLPHLRASRASGCSVMMALLTFPYQYMAVCHGFLPSSLSAQREGACMQPEAGELARHVPAQAENVGLHSCQVAPSIVRM